MDEARTEDAHVGTGMQRLKQRPEWRFFAALNRAAPSLAAANWILLLLRGTLPTAVSVCFGWLVAAITENSSTTAPLLTLGVAFTLLVVLNPIHTAVGYNLGGRLAASLYDRLMAAGTSPAGIAHLERPELTNDLTMARDFDLGMLGPPLDVSMGFIMDGLLSLVVGAVAATLLFGFAWWAPLLLIGAWTSTHYLLRESGVWKDRNTDEVRTAQRHAEYAYRLAVDASPAKELRYFGLAGWVTDRFITTRKRLYDLQYEATRLREKSVAGCVSIVAVANIAVFWTIARAAANGELSTARIVVFVQAAIGVSAVAFGGLNWALDGSSAPVAALARLEGKMAMAGALSNPTATIPAPISAPTITFRDVTFAYEAESGRHVLDRFNLTIPAGTSMAIVGQNGAGKTTIAKLLCRLYDPVSGTIEIDSTPLPNFDLSSWRERVAAVFQDFIRFELTLRTNVAPQGARDEDIRAALVDAAADDLAGGNLDRILSKGYPDGTDLSGGQWQRIALARALCSVRQGAKIVLLDEPTAQLDVRGEAEIFERVLSATKGCTTILVSHRFSTVKLADCICVLDHGEVVELGNHNELMVKGGRYRTMFDLQASRFNDPTADGPQYDEDGREVVHESL